MRAYEHALTQFGLEEFSGVRTNPKVDRFFRILGYDLHDGYAWCSAFMNWCQQMAGNEITGKLNAKSWLKWGTPTEAPKLGDVVIFHRGNPKSWKGHVGFYIREDGGYIYTLGGNQSNKVTISKYSKSRLAGYRRL